MLKGSRLTRSHNDRGSTYSVALLCPALQMEAAGCDQCADWTNEGDVHIVVEERPNPEACEAAMLRTTLFIPAENLHLWQVRILDEKGSQIS